MALKSGVRVGSYEILAAIGEGGLGEVWKARDVTTGREAALRILPQVPAGDPSRFALFEHHVRVLASRTHPNIACVYGLVEHDNRRALAVEWVGGPSLRDLLTRGDVELDAALMIAGGIAAGLTFAHGNGVAHGNLNPANVKLGADGSVKILDCGTIGLFNPGPLHEVTPVATARLFGVIIGTAAYMSPEQVRGEHVTIATDVWAFGCVLYELLAGRPAFTGADLAETMASVSESVPDWTLLPPTTPPSIVELLRRYLDKDVKTRVVDLSEASYLNLEGTLELGSREALLRDLALEQMRASDEQSPSATLRSQFERLHPWFKEWIRGRVPSRLGLSEDEVLQEALRRVSKLVPEFGELGARWAYLRQVIVNIIRDAVRRHDRSTLPGNKEPELSRFDDREDVAAYKAALQQLTVRDRELIISRLEAGKSYDEIAILLSLPSGDAARMAVARAVKRLVAHISAGKPQ